MAIFISLNGLVDYWIRFENDCRRDMTNSSGIKKYHQITMIQFEYRQDGSGGSMKCMRAKDD